MSDKNEQATELFKHLADYIGLKDFEIEIFTSFNTADYIISLKKRFDYTSQVLNTKEFIKEYFDPIINNIKNSEAVKDSKYTLTKENTELKQEIEHLKQQIADLNVFKHHFDVQMRLNHGKIN